ncbi:MAG: ParB N-terminal domain-containing protein [Acidimicrobiia bacterium]|nr:ParB N-terminal domain-containing protein [Acidimicrobiia bacterium]
MGNEELTVSWTELKHIKVEEGFNLRGKVKPDPDLVAKIKKDGVLHPIHIRQSPDKTCFHVVDGERRYRAAIEAGLDGIHVILHEGMSDEEAMLFSFKANEEQKPWTPGQKFKMFMKLHDMGWSTSRISKALVVSKKTVQEYLKTKEKGTAETKEALASGDVPSRVASRVSNFPEEKQNVVLAKVAGKGVREALGDVREEEKEDGMVLRGPKPRAYRLAEDVVDRCQELEEIIRDQLDMAPRHKTLRAQLMIIDVLKGNSTVNEIYPDFIGELRRSNGG